MFKSAPEKALHRKFKKIALRLELLILVFLFLFSFSSLPQSFYFTTFPPASVECCDKSLKNLIVNCFSSLPPLRTSSLTFSG